MHTLTIQYDTSTTEFIQDINTFDFATKLLLRGIYTEQPTHNTLLFASQQDLVYATLAYTGKGQLQW
jgi:hypothetical protein